MGAGIVGSPCVSSGARWFAAIEVHRAHQRRGRRRQPREAAIEHPVRGGRRGACCAGVAADRSRPGRAGRAHSPCIGQVGGAMTSDTRTDEQIQRDVLAELQWDSRVQAHEVGVSVNRGIVTLSGHVDSYYKKWAAEEAALRVRGAGAVANELEIRLSSSSERTDEEIAAAAVRAIEADALLGGKNVLIAVDAGWITVRGEVDWNFQKEDVERALR